MEHYAQLYCCYGCRLVKDCCKLGGQNISICASVQFNQAELGLELVKNYAWVVWWMVVWG